MYSGKVSYKARAVVTGAGSGIGKAFALELHMRGGAVVCADIESIHAEATAELIRADGGSAIAIACDVSKLEQVEALAKSAEEFFAQPANLVINNAGVGVGGMRVEDISIEDWEWIVGVNLWGVVYGCRVFVPKLRALGEGGIINVASAASFGAAPMMGAYNATKSAAVALSETLAAELHGSGIKVTVLCPTFVKTNIIHNTRMGKNSAARNAGQKLMDRQGLSPDLVAIKTLNAFDRGQLHYLPQLDARISWALKRIAPGMFTRGMGIAGKYMPK